jgi:hypothetical protein
MMIAGIRILPHLLRQQQLTSAKDDKPLPPFYFQLRPQRQRRTLDEKAQLNRDLSYTSHLVELAPL